ncbi:MAG TPA: GTPase ObgE [Verrucomicrobiae bacterium]|nr:GTPase ObgE [Verrucomicrobiae bacterium]
MFVDEIKVYARAGHGGKGCVAFQREAYRPKGGPSGGNGGRGGSVILQADRDINNLVAQYYQPRLIAEEGKPGMGKGMDGHAGKDLLVKVPCGTLVWQLSGATREEDTSDGDDDARILPVGASMRPRIRHSGSARAVEIDLAEEPVASVGARAKGDLVTDLTSHGQQFVLCKGGRGGLGNRNFATARRQTPRFAQPGEPGDEGEYLLELRIMAEVGLVGYPNAGKSTLLTAISRARPKVAPYPFTTLHPQIGIVEYRDYHRLTVCDVPGLIKGAHENVGLGHAFLRHIQRCKVLVILLDMAGTDNRRPWDDYHDLLDELKLYDPTLLKRRRLVVANKMDEAAAQKNLKQFKAKVKRTAVLQMAAAFDQGIDEFKQAIRKAVEEK